MENKFKSPITKEVVALELVKTTLEAKIKGFEDGKKILGENIHPNTLHMINFAIKELEEVLTTLNREWSN